MMRFQWNALRVGDHVLVHDSLDNGMQLLPGTVAVVDTAKGSNDIGVRVVPAHTPPSVRRPPRLAVHLDPVDQTEFCWRCEAIATSTATGRNSEQVGV